MHNQLNLYYKTMLIKKFIISYVLIINSCKNDTVRIIIKDIQSSPSIKQRLINPIKVNSFKRY